MAWAQLVRVPNLPTVPGDPIAGFLLACACGHRAPAAGMIAPVVAAILLYMAGLISNDIFDLAEDRRDRPTRPLASGAITLPQAWLAYAVLTAVALALAATSNAYAAGIAGAILVVSFLYNFDLKRRPIAGTIAMGACRALSLLLGASAAAPAALGATPVLAGAAGMALYIAAITRIAADETCTLRIGPRRWLPAAALAMTFIALFSFFPPAGGGSRQDIAAALLPRFLAALSVAWAVRCGSKLSETPSPAVVARTIGEYIRGLLLAQAGMAAIELSPGRFIAAALVAAWPVSRALGRKFYAS